MKRAGDEPAIPFQEREQQRWPRACPASAFPLSYKGRSASQHRGWARARGCAVRAPVPRCTHPSVAPASPSSRWGSVFTPESKCLSQAPGWQCGKILDTPRVKRGLALCSACLFAEKASKLPGVTATPVTVAPYPPEATGGGTWQERGAQCHRISPARPALGGGSAAPEVTGTCPGASPGAGRILCSSRTGPLL